MTPPKDTEGWPLALQPSEVDRAQQYIAEPRHSNEQHWATPRPLTEHASVAAEQPVRDHARTGLNLMPRDFLRG